MKSWWNRPKITPLQLLLMFAGFFYFMYLNTSYFDDLPDLIKALIYAFGLIATALAGYSAIDSKRLVHLLKKTMRQKNKTYEVKWGECMDVIDDFLYDLDRGIKNKKKQKGGKKKDG